MLQYGLLRHGKEAAARLWRTFEVAIAKDDAGLLPELARRIEGASAAQLLLLIQIPLDVAPTLRRILCRVCKVSTILAKATDKTLPEYGTVLRVLFTDGVKIPRRLNAAKLGKKVARFQLRTILLFLNALRPGVNGRYVRNFFLSLALQPEFQARLSSSSVNNLDRCRRLSQLLGPDIGSCYSFLVSNDLQSSQLAKMSINYIGRYLLRHIGAAGISDTVRPSTPSEKRMRQTLRALASGTLMPKLLAAQDPIASILLLLRSFLRLRMEPEVVNAIAIQLVQTLEPLELKCDAHTLSILLTNSWKFHKDVWNLLAVKTAKQWDLGSLASRLDPSGPYFLCHIALVDRRAGEQMIKTYLTCDPSAVFKRWSTIERDGPFPYLLAGMSEVDSIAAHSWVHRCTLDLWTKMLIESPSSPFGFLLNLSMFDWDLSRLLAERFVRNHPAPTVWQVQDLPLLGLHCYLTGKRMSDKDCTLPDPERMSIWLGGNSGFVHWAFGLFAVRKYRPAILQPALDRIVHQIQFHRQRRSIQESLARVINPHIRSTVRDLLEGVPSGRDPRSGQIKKTEAIQREAVSLNPQNPYTRVGLGRLLLEKGAPEDAEVEFRAALQLKPDLAEALPLLISALIRQNKWSEVQKFDEMLFELDPQSDKVHLGKALTALRSGDFAAAKSHLDELLSRHPRHARAHQHLANVLLNLNRPDEAVKHLKIALALKPEMSKAHFLLGEAYLQRAEYPNAVDEFETSIRIKDGFAPAYDGLGRAFEGRGDRSNALRAYEKALEFDQHNNHARERLLILNGDRE